MVWQSIAEEGLQVSPAWRRAFPGAVAGLLAVSGAAADSENSALAEAKRRLEQELAEQFPDRAAIKADPVIQAYAAHYKRFKKTYFVTLQVESVALKGRSIPQVTPLVTAMFMAELKNRLLTAGHDLSKVQGPVRLEAAQGGEEYLGMGGRKQVIKAGDMFMADQAGVISDVVYGPDERSKITAATGQALFAVYAPAGIGARAVKQHLADIRDYIRLFAPKAETLLLETYQADP